MTSIITIVGARPQFIKAAAVNRAIRKLNQDSEIRISEKILHTGQHYDDNMSQVFFEELEIPPPHFNLGVGSGNHGAQTGRMLEKIEEVLLAEKPDWILIYGDTNSTLAGALSAVKLHIPVAHIEAGLRSFNRRMPEEINRLLADQISNLLFCPTKTAVENLRKEGITKGVHLIGDVMFDCILFYKEKAQEVLPNMLEKYRVQTKSYYLVTLHRAENTDNPQRLKNIFRALNDISSEKCPVILPLHPRTKKYLTETGIEIGTQVKIFPPATYLEMIAWESQAKTILTDSGGVQKEAYWFQVPCITLRDETEWVETVALGWNTLVSADYDRTITAVDNIAGKTKKYITDLYGDGHTAEKIIKVLSSS
jgi:UDP-GlcNAc3NAcA epimerase